MIFTACALVAERYGAGLKRLKNLGYETFHTGIHSTLAKSLIESRKQNAKIDILLEEYSAIKMNTTSNQKAINDFIDWVVDISECINSNEWRGEDVMGIFFNEFNRYRKKKEMGQILTPDHVTSFMYRLVDVNQDDRVLDAACGTGAFIVKAMCNMMRAAGGYSSAKSKDIRMGQLFGIEVDRRVFALACANMLIHKDGKTNLEQLDSRYDAASKWIKSKAITKVLMNPPYERKYGCIKIVENVLDSVPSGTLCAFILPDKKLEKDNGWKLLKHHYLKTIVKMPEDLFFGVGVTTSIFVFETGIPQGDKDIIGYYIEDDGLETVKNKGRQDVKNRWSENEDYWIKAIQNHDDWKYKTRQVIHPTKTCLSYQMPERPIEIHEEDFIKTIMDYEMYKRGIDVRLMTPGIPDKKLTYSVTRSYYNMLITSGVRIYEYSPGFNHSKTFLCDDTCAVVGTINLDFRSLYHHFENAVYMYRTDCLKDIKQDFLNTFDECRDVTEKYRKKPNMFVWFFKSILRLIAPLL